MSTETILFTVLPAGLESADVMRLSIFVSPRLSPSGTLADFALGNWAARMMSLGLTVEFDGGPIVPAQIDTTLLDPNLWAGLFPDTTPVEGWMPSGNAGRELRSFPAHSLHQFIQGLYGAVASDPGSAAVFPSLAQGPVADLVNTVGRIDEVLCRVVGAALGVAVPTAPLVCQPKDERTVLAELPAGPARDFFRAYQFYHRSSPDRVAHLGEAVPPASPSPEVPTVDFHQAIAMLGDWPRVLRMLGLVLDCRVPLRSGLPPSSRVHVRDLKWNQPPSTTVQTPWTMYQLDGAGFRAAPRGPGSDLDAGLLRLGKKGAFEIMQVDVDGAALNVLQFATSMRRYQTEVAKNTPGPPPPLGGAFASDAPERAALPALRGGGITVARVDRATPLKTQLIAATANSSLGGAANLAADDLTRGYRVDVQVAGKWFSLCRRAVKFTLPGIAPFSADCSDGAPVFDEGYVKGSAGSSAMGSAPTDPLYVHESMFGWSGWSLVAQRPGRVIPPLHEATTPPALPKPNARGSDAAVAAKVPFDVQTEVHAQPGTLPRLRFGRPYRLRARAVDLGGNGLPLGAEAPAGSDAYTDFIVYQRYEPVTAPVLCPSAPLTLGEHVEALVVRSKANAMASETDLPGSLFNSDTSRHVLPPRTSESMYETHGLLDGFATPAASFAVAALESASLQDQTPQTTIYNLDGSVAFDGGTAMTWPDTLAQGQYVVRSALAEVPYLPDPLAAGASFLGFPGSPLVKQAYPGAPPGAGMAPVVQPLQLRLSTGALSFGPSGAQLLASLPPGTIVKLRYSTAPDMTRLMNREMALWNLVPAAQQATLKVFAADGFMWQLTPYRELQLIHAVERPVNPPTLGVTPVDESAKPVGQTYSPLQGTIGSHSGSTGDVELVASWTEVEDRIDGPTGETREARAGHVGVVNIPYGEDARPFPAPAESEFRHEFGDTKHRWITYQPVGSTRFREHFPTSVTDRPDLITLAGTPIPAPLDIFSTRRPDAPRVVYIVPTFKWVPSTDGSTRQRIGRGLRVYLERPWFSSGDDEKLGVVLVQPPRPTAGIALPGIPPILHRYTSQWGSDPVTSGPVPNVDREMAPEHIVNAEQVLMENLSLDEMPPSPALAVRAVGLPVEFSADRRLWYCDIEFDPGRAYYPYVNLSLARLQEHAIADAHLSRVVRTEFAQLVADRTATINRRTDGNVEVIDVTVIGVSAPTDAGEKLLGPTIIPLGQAATLPPTAGGPPVVQPPPIIGQVRNPAAGAGHSVRVYIERRRAGTPGDLGWERDSDDFTLDSYTFFLSPEVFWRGSLRRLVKPTTPASEYRLVIREFEVYDTDPLVAERIPGLGNPAQRSLGERLVYLDIFPLP